MRFVVSVLLIGLIVPLTGCKKSAPEPAGEPKSNAAVPARAEYDLKQLGVDLRSGNRERRATAIRNAPIMEEDGEAVIPILLDALKDPAAENLGSSSYDRPTSARETAVLALLAIKDKGKKALLDSGLKLLEADLTNSKETIREHTANAIGMIGSDAKRSADAVAKLCGDKNRDVRSAAYRALEKLGTFDTIPVLQLLSNPDLAIAADAATALGWLKTDTTKAVPALLEAIKRPTRDKDNANDAQLVRNKAAEALASAGKSEGVVPALIDLLLKAKYEDVERALQEAKQGERGTWVSGPMLALRRIGKPAVEPLRPLLKHEQPVVRYQAAAILGGIKEADAAPALPDILTALEVERTLPMGQIYVFEELVAAGLNLNADPVRMAAIVGQILGHDDEKVRYRAVRLISRFRKRAAPAVPKLTELINDSAKGVQQAAIETLGSIGPAAKEAVSELGKKLEDGDTYLAAASANALRSIGPASAPATPALAKALDSNDQNLSSAAAKAIAAIGPEAVGAVDALVRHLDDAKTRPDERRVLLAAVSAIGPLAKAAIPAVTKLLADKDASARVLAIETLGNIGPGNAEVIKALTGKLADNSQTVQTTALRVLGEMGPAAKSAVDSLKPLLSRSTPIKVWAAAALTAIGVEADANAKIVLDVAKDRSAANRIPRSAALEAVALLGPKGKPAIPELIDAIKEKPTGPTRGDQVTTRELAARSLGKIGAADADTVKALNDLLNDQSATTRKAAAEALGGIGEKAITSVPKLRNLTEWDNVAGPAAEVAIRKIEGTKGE